MYGFYRIAAAVPQIRVADTAYNTVEIIRCAKEAETNGAAVVLFPELSVTGSSCGDLFFQKLLTDNALDCTKKIAEAFADSDLKIIVGLPVQHKSHLYNCAAFLSGGKIVSLTPQIHLPAQRANCGKRQFCPGGDLLNRDFFTMPGTGDKIPFTNLVICGKDVRIGIEFGQDLRSMIPPSQILAAEAGANLLLDLSADNALVAEAQYTRSLVKTQSARCIAAYVYASAGVHESTTDSVFSGHAMICENGTLLAENKRFQRDSEILYADVDLDRINSMRVSDGAAQDVPLESCGEGTPDIGDLRQADELKFRTVDPQPFIPADAEQRDTVCSEIFAIQTAGLTQRMEASRSQKMVLGISGGLDSTLAMLVAANSLKQIGLPPDRLVAITMPGFGTTQRTKSNSEKLAQLLGCDLRLIDITEACLLHFRDIGHDKDVLDVTYENVQARERTQILMDTANREHALVIGTGDLSEVALGWCTYNADHMSMYGVNCDVPKTLIRHMVDWFADKAGGELSAVLKDVLATPVSPELLPADKTGKIAQKTESILGAYELHDFYLYHVVRYGAEPAKLRFLAKYAFTGKYSDAEIDRTLNLFYRRFFTQQFKRSCCPDGPKVGSIALSPRTDWHMPSDASAALWLDSLNAK